MNDIALLPLIAQYRTALQAQVTLLHEIEALARDQFAASTARDFGQLATATARRNELTSTLSAIEDGLHAVRRSLDASRADVERLPAFSAVADLRKTAAELLAQILSTDQESMKLLADVELARRIALAAFDHGEATLAAYRKVLAPPLATTSLLNRLG